MGSRELSSTDFESLQVFNEIEICKDGKQEERNSVPSGITIHRVGKDLRNNISLGDHATEISAHFTGKIDTYPEVSRATGGQNPYTFMVGGEWADGFYDGYVWQVLPVKEIGRHARIWSRPTIGIAMIGDFRERGPTRMQWISAVRLVGELCQVFALNPAGRDRDGYVLAGHDERQNGSSDPRKECPGGLWDMGDFRSDVRDWIQGTAAIRLGSAGVQW